VPCLFTAVLPDAAVTSTLQLHQFQYPMVAPVQFSTLHLNSSGQLCLIPVSYPVQVLSAVSPLLSPKPLLQRPVASGLVQRGQAERQRRLAEHQVSNSNMQTTCSPAGTMMLQHARLALLVHLSANIHCSYSRYIPERVSCV
jgi:hypothetical protein